MPRKARESVPIELGGVTPMVVQTNLENVGFTSVAVDFDEYPRVWVFGDLDGQTYIASAACENSLARCEAIMGGYLADIPF